MTVREDGGANPNSFTDGSLYGKPASVNFRLDTFYDDASSPIQRWLQSGGAKQADGHSVPGPEMADFAALCGDVLVAQRT